MKRLAMSLILIAITACGGKSKPAAPPTAPDPGSRGIEAADVAAMSCYEDCMTNGPHGADAGWASKSDADRKAACGPACPVPKK